MTSQADGIIWPCTFCGEWITQPFHRDLGWTQQQIQQSFAAQVDAHVAFHTDFLMDEIAEVLHGQKPHGSI